MKTAPDAVTLDAMVSGLDEADDGEAWEFLLTSSGASELWSQALERRLRIDGYAQALIAHPWIAQFQHALRTWVQTLTPSSGIAIEAVVEREHLLADLGQTAEAPTRLAAPSWGRIETALVSIGTTVGLRWVAEAEHEGPLHFFYKTSTAEGQLPEGLWRLEAGEAPVLLLAFERANGAKSVEEALACAQQVAGILLLEESPHTEET